MTHKVADNWFNDVDFVSIVSTVKGIMTSDGSMSTLLDFERVIDELDIYAFKNWELGELVQGPTVGRYTTSCIFMWPYKLMPDPKAVKRLLAVGCEINWEKTKVDVPVEVKVTKWPPENDNSEPDEPMLSNVLLLLSKPFFTINRVVVAIIDSLSSINYFLFLSSYSSCCYFINS